MLAIRASGQQPGPTLGALAEQLLIRHHSAVGLIDRLAARGLVQRLKVEGDRREVRVHLTAEGEARLRRLSHIHREELRRAGPALVSALTKLLQQGEKR